MLKNLNISNAAVAKSVCIDFDRGFTVVTGETGSGKSVMIDCLELIAGSKSTRDIVRHGADRASVEALFELSPDKCSELSSLGVEPDENGELQVLRTVTSDGKSTSRAGGRSITQAQLREVGTVLLGINTQDEKNYLSRRSEYTAVLDSFAACDDELDSYRAAYAKLCEVNSELSSLKAELDERTMMTDILTYQIREIDAAHLTSDDEEERLERLRTRLRFAERTEKGRRIIYRALCQNEKGYSAAYLLERASAALSQIADVVEGAEDMMRRLDECRYEIEDIGETVNESLDTDIDGDPGERLTQIERRLNTIDRLKKKYGATISEIRAFREDAEQKLRRITDSEETLASLERRRAKLIAECTSAADILHEVRCKAAEALSAEIIGTLRYLDMPKVVFTVDVLAESDGETYRFTPSGADSVDFKISVNPGEPLVSIARVASGGEMSRVMLALRSSMNRRCGADTVIFDEIDAGVSGSTSEKIGHLLRRLSADVQVICVTHSPQIAALADHHYLICKSEVDGRAESSVVMLDEEERVSEISRIIGGINVTDKQRAAAREMLQGRLTDITEETDE